MLVEFDAFALSASPRRRAASSMRRRACRRARVLTLLITPRVLHEESLVARSRSDSGAYRRHGAALGIL